MIKRKKAVVTGGAGFIGSHLVEELVRQNYNVLVLDNLSTGTLQNLKNVKKKIKFIKCDLSNNNNLTKYLNKADYIFHLAGLSEVTKSLNHPNKYYAANFISTLNILNAARNLKIRKLIYSASASCYGNSKQIPTSEKAKIQILSPYALTKWLSEELILKLAKKHKLPAISLRLFNVYGPRFKTIGIYSSVIGVFIRQKVKKTPFTVTGDGFQCRSFVYVSDVVNAMTKAAKSKISGEIFNVGAKKSVQINKIAKLLNGKKIYISRRKGDPKNSVANIRKIKKYLKWSPTFDISFGINKTLEWYRKKNLKY